jgi:hypothetical protein
MVRQLFELGIIQSGFWHQFALTAHSPIGLNPEEYGITPKLEKIEFANNDVEFLDKTNIDHSKFNAGLKKSLYNYMHGVGFELPLKDWFDFHIPSTTVKSTFIESCLSPNFNMKLKPNSKVIFMGNIPLTSDKGKKKTLHFELKTSSFSITLEQLKADWLLKKLNEVAVHQRKACTVAMLKEDFESKFEDFEPFWFSKPIQTLRAKALLVL